MHIEEIRASLPDMHEDRKGTVSFGISMAGATPTREVDPLTVTQRLQREGRWHGQVELERDDMMRLAKDRFTSKAGRQAWVYAELDRMYPPLEAPSLPEPAESTATMSRSGEDSGSIQGLGDLPADWPELPSNASLSSEIGWVQANRLRVVEERPGAATRIRLGLALNPAPSWAALGWLETSVRSYAKYVDVASKATASDDGEAVVMKRERVALDEVRRLLAEMREAAKEERRRLEEEG